MNDTRHVPVLLTETMQALNVQPGGVVIDATYGRGGHAVEIMKRLGENGSLLALDRDPTAVAAARHHFAGDSRVRVEHGPFSQLGSYADRHALTGRVTGILFDLGVSSPQLNDPARGFSFRHDGPLDMRMDPTRGVSAAQWINSAEESELARVFREYGEERFAKRIARTIVRARHTQPIVTTRALAELVAQAIPTRERSKDPATRTFQAIRIYVNGELAEIEQALPQAMRALAPRGRLAVISFHSLEDRIVKQFFQYEAKGGDVPLDLPIRAADLNPRLKIIGRRQRATDIEIARNPRARSATLRVAERTEALNA